MISYFSLWAAIIFLVFFGKIKELKTFSFLSIFLLLFLFIGLRPITLGTDTVNYFDIYQTFNFGVFDSGLEYAFSFFVILFKSFNLDFSYFLAFLCLLFLSGIAFFSRSFYRNDISFLLLVVSSLGFWLFSVNIVRGGIAFSFFLIGLVFYMDYGRRSLGFLISFCVAIGFHISIAVAFLILYFLPRGALNKNINKIPLVVITSLILYFTGFDIVSILYDLVFSLQSYLPDRLVSKFFIYYYSTDFQPSKIGFSYFLSLFMVMLSIFYIKKHKKIAVDRAHDLFVLSIFFVSIFLVFYPLFINFSVFSRVLSSFEFFYIILVYELIKLNIRPKHVMFIILLFSSLLFVKVVITGFSYNFLMDRF